MPFSTTSNTKDKQSGITPEVLSILKALSVASRTALISGIFLNLSLTACNYNVEQTEHLPVISEEVISKEATNNQSVNDQPSLDVKTSTLNDEQTLVNQENHNSAQNAQASYIDPKSLGSNANAPVNDFTQTLSTDDIARLDSKIRGIYDEELLQIGVVLVPSTGNMSTFDYAMQVAKAWQLGDSETNNGLLILLSMDNRDMYILTGLGIEDKLTDERVRSVIDEVITPQFRQGHYAEGLMLGIDMLATNMRSLLLI